MSSGVSEPRVRRALVTGISGQDGHYLAGQLIDDGIEVFGLTRSDAPVAAGVQALRGDLRDASSLRRAIDACRPDQIYNLAAATFVPGSWENPGEVEDVNGGGVERLIDAIRACGLPIRLCHASSAEIFGPPSGKPQDEHTELAPASPYARGKARAHRAIAAAREEHGLFACSAILFNHESPRRPTRFVTRKIAMAVARIHRGLGDHVTLGSLEASRDWGYAPEYVAAMRDMLAAPQPADYVVATGRSATVADFARLAFASVGLEWRRHIRFDASLARPGDSLARIGDPSRIAKDLGWRATTSLEDLVRIMVDADLVLLDKW
ncbi:MAG TPA: GDP-mannose 4,6-dehydratase [Candidatus Binatia bacterium]|jgi:GDPmannose 4,6-dehydratase